MKNINNRISHFFNRWKKRLEEKQRKIEEGEKAAHPERWAVRAIMEDRELHRRFMDEGEVEIDGKKFKKIKVYPKY